MEDIRELRDRGSQLIQSGPLDCDTVAKTLHGSYLQSKFGYAKIRTRICYERKKNERFVLK